MKICIHCKEEKEDSYFCRDYRHKEIKLTNLCKSCKSCKIIQNRKYKPTDKTDYNKQVQEKRIARKKRAITYKGGVCEICKQSYHYAAFDFHHLDPKTKVKDPGLMMTSTDEVLFKELDKCILLCANCHRILHAEEGSLGKSSS